MNRAVYVYRVEVEYPPGSDAPGWTPACWPQLLAGIEDKRQRAAVRRRGFRWPRERLYLSPGAAWHRAMLLDWFGAGTEVYRSHAVTWPDYEDETANGEDWEDGTTVMRWTPEPAGTVPGLTAADVREAMTGIFAEEGWKK